MVFHNISYPFKKIALIFFCAFIFHDLLARQYQDTLVSNITDDSTEIATAGGEGDEAITDHDDNITARQALTKRSIPDSVISNLKKQQEFEYANDPAYWKEKVNDSGSNDFDFSPAAFGVIRMLIWTGVVCLLLFLFYKAVIKNKLYMFYSSSARNNLEEPVGEIEDENLDDRIREAASRADYRSAVRYMYLKSLKLLNEKGWIKYTAQGSNAEYVNAVNKHAAGASFRYLTKNYEYVWYGGFALNEERFGVINGQFEQFYQSVKTSGNSIKSTH